MCGSGGATRGLKKIECCFRKYNSFGIFCLPVNKFVVDVLSDETGLSDCTFSNNCDSALLAAFHADVVLAQFRDLCFLHLFLFSETL